MDFYTSRLTQFTEELTILKKQYNTLSTLRLLSVIAFLIFGYYSLQQGEKTVYIVLMAICTVAFIYFMRKHNSVSKMKVRAEALIAINKNEIAYLKRESIPFNDGNEFTATAHSYSYDLDIFGKQSLFHNLNRTETFKGKEKLSNMLLSILPEQEILNNQEAIKELASKAEWRQEIMALGRANKDSSELYHKLISWSKSNFRPLPVWINIVSVAAPLLLVLCMLWYFVSGNAYGLSFAGYLFTFNLMFLSVCSKSIKEEISNTTEIHEIIYRYSLIIEQIEKESFEGKKLNNLKEKLVYKKDKASKEIKKLSELFSRMDSINNLFAMVLFNGTFLFHVHTLRSLLKWKKEHAEAIGEWMDIVAEAEALGSLGNLYFNNPDFTFPKLNSENKVEFKNLAHPLLNPETRIGNDVDFNPGFMILTGSNMSGKSTFLRSLGVNMVLAGIGAPVCAKEANIHPLPVLVSMRLSDSLSDSESYFFAEIKRLKQIMDSLKNQPAFVLLDEILRGTNSDDKRTGTIEVVKKMVQLNAIGAIATHDIEVCNTTYEYPASLSNHCFEVQIVNNDLYFDYILREGICKNKSATFLMEKMGVI
jgi:DNA mismatch repair ATPase MutS